MEEKLRYKIPKPEQAINKRTGQKGYKIFNYTWYENGKRKVSDTKWHLTKQECILEAQERIKGSSDLIYVQGKLKIKELIEEYQLYIKDVSIDDVAPATKKNRYDNCNALLRYSTDRVLNEKVANLDVDVMKLWMNTLRNSKAKRTGLTLSKEYVDGLKNLISLILRYADGKNYFHNSMERYNSLLNYLYNDTRASKTKKTKKEFRYMTYDEFKKFATCCLYDLDVKEDEEDVEKYMMPTFHPVFEIDFSKCKYKNVIYFYFFVCMFFLGTRTEEARILGWSDIDFNAGQHEGRVTISKAYTSHYFKSDVEAYLHKLRTKNAGSIRRIPIHPQLKHLLLQYRKYLESKDIKRDELFPGDDNGFISYSQINHKIERTLLKSGLENKKFTKHDFRRSCAMYLCYDLKLPKDQAISFFGWTSTDMLNEVYARFNEIQKAEVLEKNLDEVGFFDVKFPIMYAKDGKIYYNIEVDKNFKTKEMDEYRKVYTKEKETKRKGYSYKKTKNDEGN